MSIFFKVRQPNWFKINLAVIFDGLVGLLTCGRIASDLQSSIYLKYLEAENYKSPQIEIIHSEPEEC